MDRWIDGWMGWMGWTGWTGWTGVDGMDGMDGWVHGWVDAYNYRNERATFSLRVYMDKALRATHKHLSCQGHRRHGC